MKNWVLAMRTVSAMVGSMVKMVGRVWVTVVEVSRQLIGACVIWYVVPVCGYAVSVMVNINICVRLYGFHS